MTVQEKKDAVKVIDRAETATNTDFQENISEKKEPLQEENIKYEVSGFSLSSIAVKKAAKKNNPPRDKKENLPKDSFDKESLLKFWVEYSEYIKVEGKQNISSIMKMNQPDIISKSTISFDVANDMNKVEMTREMKYLIPFISEKLNHFGIKIEIAIKKKNQEDYIYSPQEKYQYLLKINPSLDKLRKKFDLDF
jgi:DNA polymerase-3 subunit gamma/tau